MAGPQGSCPTDCQAVEEILDAQVAVMYVLNMKHARFVLSCALLIVSLTTMPVWAQITPSGLIGEYQGVYTVITGYYSPQSSRLTDSIAWTFTPTQYQMQVLATEAQVDFCSPAGRYLLAVDISFAQSFDGCEGTVADPTMNPTGVFSIGGTSNWIIITQVNWVDSVFKTIRLLREGACCFGPRGNVDGSSESTPGGVGIDIADLTYMVSWMFRAGPAPPCLEEADINASGGEVNIADLTYLARWMFLGDIPPPDCP